MSSLVKRTSPVSSGRGKPGTECAMSYEVSHADGCADMAPGEGGRGADGWVNTRCFKKKKNGKKKKKNLPKTVAMKKTLRLTIDLAPPNDQPNTTTEF
jgi:hypothetical protein